MAPKRKSGTAKAAAKAAQKLAEAAPPLENLDFLEAGAGSTSALYRVASSDPCRERRPVQDENASEVVPPGSFPNPYLVIDFNDKHGVWQKETALSKALGQDPATSCRHATPGFWRPAGLRNLGATCYLNSLLQYLFFNLDFRYSLLRAPSQSQVVAALQRVFALLSEGESLVVDPKDFVTAARVDALEQADATEFSALLLDWLQRELSAGGGAEFIPALFEGQSSTIVQCSQDPSHFSEKPESFMELRAGLSPVAVALEAKEATGRKSGPKTKPGAKKSNKKLPTIRLEQILEETAFPEEVLDGSNQWLCPRCDRKVDAKRTTRLSKLPPYLHVTVERYHFEAETAQRKRLAHPVSFPRRLELRLGGALASQRPEATSSETAMLPVAYECIGYLEHVSDSAHSGHYRATLLREEEEPYVSAVAGLVGDEVKEPALKRPKVDDPDAAAGAPQKRSWWRLDDESVTPVESVESEASGAGAPKAAEGTSSSSAAPPQASDPERIESATAYLVLYRRCDHDPGQLCQGRRVSGVPRTAPPLSSELQRCVDEHNTELRRQRKEFESNSLAVERFVGERRRAVMCLAEALRALHPSQGSSSDLNLVPSPWLERFLRGEDRTLQNILEGDASIQPPIYSSSLIQGRTGHALDPLAVWCGEVKLLPTAALEQVGGQFGGLDSSTFLRAEAAMNEEVATLVFKAFEHFRKEFHLKGVLQSNRFSVTDVRAVESSEQGFAVWISIRQLNQWKKVVGDTSSTASLRQLWRCFVQEVHEYRFGISPEGGAADAPEASDDEVAVEASRLEVPSDVKEATTPRVKPLTLLGGLLCRHQLLSRPRAAALVSRSQLEELLEVSHEKDSAFRELWQSAASMRPRVRTGLPGNKLLSFADVCSECRGAGTEEVKRKATGSGRPQAKRKASTGKQAEREGSAFNNSVFLSSAASNPPEAETAKVAVDFDSEPPLLE
ncbi:unnamed protein product [Durusdinium trenchii]|uniref:ubiquitinyl hydrolase 1 n=1 Tax=Durusdinium trenchii TaxID=1381693 RepID=A0ABP0KQE8_9DINO